MINILAGLFLFGATLASAQDTAMLCNVYSGRTRILFNRKLILPPGEEAAVLQEGDLNFPKPEDKGRIKVPNLNAPYCIVRRTGATAEDKKLAFEIPAEKPMIIFTNVVPDQSLCRMPGALNGPNFTVAVANTQKFKLSCFDPTDNGFSLVFLDRVSGAYGIKIDSAGKPAIAKDTSPSESIDGSDLTTTPVK